MQHEDFEQRVKARFDKIQKDCQDGKGLEMSAETIGKVANLFVDIELAARSRGIACEEGERSNHLKLNDGDRWVVIRIWAESPEHGYVVGGSGHTVFYVAGEARVFSEEEGMDWSADQHLDAALKVMREKFVAPT